MTALVIVIPALNEAEALPATLEAIASALDTPRPVVVADAGSTDATASAAAAAGAAVVSADRPDGGPAGRGAAMRAGVAAALARHPDAEVLWLLHADTHPPIGADRLILDALAAQPAAVAGAFRQRFATRHVGPWTRRKLHFIAMCNRLRYGLSGLYFGDQGLFVRRASLELIGGVPEAPLFEDVEMVRRLRGVGRVVLLPARITTSPRRFVDAGVFRQGWRDLRLLVRHRLGLPLARQAAAYNAVNTDTTSSESEAGGSGGSAAGHG